MNKRIRLSMTVAVTVIAQQAPAQITLDENWTVTVAGQTVQVNPDGSFAIPNVAAPDLFGAGGPGSRPDFLSDDFLRVIAVGEVDGQPHYAFSEFFQIEQGVPFEIGKLTFTASPPLTNHSLSVSIADSVLTVIGQTTQLETIALMSDGGLLDVTPRIEWTVYRTSNPSIATVGPDGLVTAVDRGPIFLTAVNEGATATISAFVSPGDPLTTIDGFVRNPDKSPVVGAIVRVFDKFEQKASGVTDETGHYEIPNVVTLSGLIHIKAYVPDSNILRAGVITGLTPFPGGLTDAGIITIGDFGKDLDNDRMPDFLEAMLGLDPGNPDTDGDGILDGFEDFDGDRIVNCEELALGTNPALADTDSDRLDDGDELIHGTDPLDIDTDDDGFIDGEEIEFGSDALARRDLPVDPTATLGEMVFPLISIENRGLPESDIAALEMFRRVISVENRALPDPGLPHKEMFSLTVSVENVPGLGLPPQEAFSPSVSVENTNEP